MNGSAGAEEVLWDLGDLYSGGEDPNLEKDLADSEKKADSFASSYRGRIAELQASELAGAIEEYEQLRANEGKLKDSLDVLIDRAVLPNPRLVARLSFIVYAIRRTAEIGSEIAEVAITKALSKQTSICKPVVPL